MRDALPALDDAEKRIKPVTPKQTRALHSLRKAYFQNDNQRDLGQRLRWNPSTVVPRSVRPTPEVDSLYLKPVTCEKSRLRSGIVQFRVSSGTTQAKVELLFVYRLEIYLNYSYYHGNVVYTQWNIYFSLTILSGTHILCERVLIVRYC